MHHPLTSSDRYTPSGQTRRISRLSGSPPRKLLWHAVAAGLLLALAAPEALAATFTYACSSNRIYIRDGGPATLSDIHPMMPSGPVTCSDGVTVRQPPLVLVDAANKIWLLRANIIIQDSSTLNLHADNDVRELRLKSEPAEFVRITTEPIAANATTGEPAHSGSGNLHLQGLASCATVAADCVKVVSWNEAANDVDRDPVDGRAFLRARSELVPGGTNYESRMDVINAEVAFLGYDAAESYGLSWKVNDADGADPANPTPGLYDQVQVRGDVIGSHIHDNWMGIYSFALQDGVWRGNHVHHNIKYGFDAHDDTDNLTIEGNDVHDNGNHGIILSKRCDGGRIINNRSYQNTGNGIMVHVTSDNAVIDRNTVSDNTDAGVAVFNSFNTVVSNNTVLGNLLAGIRVSEGAADNLIESNEVANGGQFGLYVYQGTGGFGGPARNTFRGNRIHDNVSDPVKVTDAGAQNAFVDNVFGSGAGRVYFQDTPGVMFSGNTLPDALEVQLSGSPEFHTDVEFSRSPRINLQMNSNSLARFVDGAGAVFDPATVNPFVTVSGSNSVLELHYNDLPNGDDTIYMRALFASTDGSTLSIAPTVWETSGDYRKDWLARASAAGTTIQYTVGDLQPGASYDARRGSTLIGAFVADGSGRINFSDSPGSLDTLTFSVTKSAAQTQTGGGGGGGGGGGALDLTLLALLAGILALKRRVAG